MNRTRRALLGVATSYGATGVTAVAGFLLVPLILRFVSRADYGLWAAVGQAIAYLALLDFGVGSAVIRRTAQLRGRTDAALAASRTLSTATALYCVLGGVLLAA